jgi:hypothetical protein
MNTINEIKLSSGTKVPSFSALAASESKRSFASFTTIKLRRKK